MGGSECVCVCVRVCCVRVFASLVLFVGGGGKVVGGRGGREGARCHAQNVRTQGNGKTVYRSCWNKRMLECCDTCDSKHVSAVTARMLV